VAVVVTLETKGSDTTAGVSYDVRGPVVRAVAIPYRDQYCSSVLLRHALVCSTK
jgi:hypothetical protein